MEESAAREESTHKKEMTLPLFHIFTFYFLLQFCTFFPFTLSLEKVNGEHKNIILIFRHFHCLVVVVVGIIIVIVINNECNAVQKWKIQFAF